MQLAADWYPNAAAGYAARHHTLTAGQSVANDWPTASTSQYQQQLQVTNAGKQTHSMLGSSHMHAGKPNKGQAAKNKAPTTITRQTTYQDTQGLVTVPLRTDTNKTYNETQTKHTNTTQICHTNKQQSKSQPTKKQTCTNTNADTIITSRNKTLRHQGFPGDHST